MPSHALFFVRGVVLGPVEVNPEVFFEELLAPTGHTGSPSSHGEPPGTYCVTFWDPFLSQVVPKRETFVDFEENRAYQCKRPSIRRGLVPQGV